MANDDAFAQHGRGRWRRGPASCCGGCRCTPEYAEMVKGRYADITNLTERREAILDHRRRVPSPLRRRGALGPPRHRRHRLRRPPADTSARAPPASGCDCWWRPPRRSLPRGWARNANIRDVSQPGSASTAGSRAGTAASVRSGRHPHPPERDVSQRCTPARVDRARHAAEQRRDHQADQLGERALDPQVGSLGGPVLNKHMMLAEHDPDGRICSSIESSISPASAFASAGRRRDPALDDRQDLPAPDPRGRDCRGSPVAGGRVAGDGRPGAAGPSRPPRSAAPVRAAVQSRHGLRSRTTTTACSATRSASSPSRRSRPSPRSSTARRRSPTRSSSASASST